MVSTGDDLWEIILTATRHLVQSGAVSHCTLLRLADKVAIGIDVGPWPYRKVVSHVVESAIVT